MNHWFRTGAGNQDFLGITTKSTGCGQYVAGFMTGLMIFICILIYRAW